MSMIFERGPRLISSSRCTCRHRELALVQFRVDAWLAQQLAVGAALHDRPILYNQDLIGLQDGREAVRYDDGSASSESAFQGPLNSRFRFGIEMSCGLVKNDNVRPLQQE